MIYCMSDIHGELDRFKAMLDLINFSSDDTLYIRVEQNSDFLMSLYNK